MSEPQNVDNNQLKINKDKDKKWKSGTGKEKDCDNNINKQYSPENENSNNSQKKEEEEEEEKVSQSMDNNPWSAQSESQQTVQDPGGGGVKQIVVVPTTMTNDNEKEKIREDKLRESSGGFVQEVTSQQVRPSSSTKQAGVSIVQTAGGGQEEIEESKSSGGGGSSWLEEIQFKAQYQHFRSMDYASLQSINSTPALYTRVVETETRPEVVNNIRIGGLCWNFPRVNLRSLFNAKSLESLCRNAHHSQSNLASSKDPSRGHYSNSRLISVTPPVLSTASSENNFLKVPTSSKVSSKKTKIVRKSDNIIQKFLEPRVVKCAKSDNCLHRMVTTACTKLVSSSVDNLDTDRVGSGEGGERGHCDDDKLSPTPVSGEVKQLELELEKKLKGQQRVVEYSNLSTTDRPNGTHYQQKKKKTSQSGSGGRKLVVTRKSQVSPSDVTGGCEIMTKKMIQSNSTTTTSKPNTLKCGNINTKVDPLTNEKPRLVVASIMDLQRVKSKCPGDSPPEIDNYCRKIVEDNNKSLLYVNFLQRPLSPTVPFPCSQNRSQLASSPTPPGPSQLSTTTNNINTTNVFRTNFYADGSRNNIFSLSSPSKQANSSFSNNYNQHQNPFQSSGTTTLDQQQHMTRNSSSNKDGDDVRNYHYYSPDASGQGGVVRPFPEQINNNNVPPMRMISPGLPESSPLQSKMGDLQSPAYVKRTAHMFDTGHMANFDSRFTTQINGSTKDFVKDETSENGHHQNPPSYLNVSRSVCGYSCLSYNGTTTTSTTNGVSCKHRSSGGVNSDFQMSYRPATLHTNNYNKLESNKIRGGGNNISLPKNGAASSPALEIENNHNHNNTTGYTQNRCTSNILEKIERLYGSNASSTALWRPRAPVPLPHVPLSEGTTTTRSRTLPAANLQTVNESVLRNSREKIIPIHLEGSPSQYSQRRYRDVDDCHVKSLPLQTRSSIVDKERDNIEDSLYFKHNILNANQKQQNGHQPPVKLDANNSSPGPDRHSLARERVSSSEEDIKFSSHPSSKPVSNISDHQKSVKSVTSRKIDFDSPAKFEKNILDKVGPTSTTTGIMVSDKTPEYFDESTNEQKIVHPHDKTEDTIDGESKPLFNIVCNLSPELNEQSKRIPNLATTKTTPTVKGENVEGLVDLKENISGSGEPEEKNGEYFLNVIRLEKIRIEDLVKVAEARLETLDTSSEESVDNELSGKMLAAIGKARLLVNKKFKQFEGLCNDNIEQRKKGVGLDEPYTTKNEDLEGFWDMVLIQVDQIHSMFKNLDDSEGSTSTTSKSLKTGNARKTSTQKASSTSNPPSKAATAKTGNSTRDEIRRKMLAERRQAMKNQVAAQQQALSPTDPNVQIFIPDSS